MPLPTSYTLQGPDQGEIGVPITYVLALADGDELFAPITVTPSSNKQGTFSPISVPLTIENPSASVIFIPLEFGEHTISTSDDGALSDPSSIKLVIFQEVIETPPAPPETPIPEVIETPQESVAEPDPVPAEATEADPAPPPNEAPETPDPVEVTEAPAVDEGHIVIKWPDVPGVAYYEAFIGTDSRRLRESSLTYTPSRSGPHAVQVTAYSGVPGVDLTTLAVFNGGFVVAPTVIELNLI